MDINVPGILQASLPTNGKKLAVISDNMSGFTHNDPGFLSDEHPKSPPKLYITSEGHEFDMVTVADWKDEGFGVEYLPMQNGDRAYRDKLDSLRKAVGTGLGPCETFGIVAYGEAASYCLEHFHTLDNNPDFKLSCLIAYYPTRIPDPNARYPGGVHVLVHLAGDEVRIVKQSQLVGLQGKKRITRRKLDRGLGTGGTLKMAFPAYSYDADPGFSEHDMDEYDKVCAELAWSRSLATARRAFRWDPKQEGIVETNVHGKFNSKDPQQIMSTYTTQKTPRVTYVPTLTGGIGADELDKFYSSFFIDNNPPSLQLTLLSRTSGSDRVVDELHVEFKHTQGMPWILPGIPPTNRRVEVIVVSIVTLRGGKIYQEHIYWDQASVLVQTGLLNPNLVPPKAKQRGVERLPVVGRHAARRILEGGYDDEEGEADNDLIPEFWDESEEDDEEEYDSEEDQGESEAETEEELAEGTEQQGEGADYDEDVEEVARTDGGPVSEAPKKQRQRPAAQKDTDDANLANSGVPTPPPSHKATVEDDQGLSEA